MLLRLPQVQLRLRGAWALLRQLLRELTCGRADRDEGERAARGRPSSSANVSARRQRQRYAASDAIAAMLARTMSVSSSRADFVEKTRGVGVTRAASGVSPSRSRALRMT